MDEKKTAEILFSQDDLNCPEERKRAVYSAFNSKDSRFDGQIFVGVSSTGIYCRPVCRAKMPRFENCTFFHSAAEAEAAGYRPCMTCRPEVAPGMSNVDAHSNLARRAAVMLRDRCASTNSIEKVSGRLGYTSRHLRRVFLDAYGVTPLQYVQTCRLLLAKELLTDTGLPVAVVAKAAGFGSVRRFNQVFKEKYRMSPSELRKPKRSARRLECSDSSTFTVRLGYRPPYRFSELLDFLKTRALAGVEAVDDASYSRTVRLVEDDGSMTVGQIRVEDDSEQNQLVLTLSDTLAPHVPEIVGRVRRMFDTDCDPAFIAESIAPIDKLIPGSVIKGTRLPGCFDPFEMACRAVLGQQISVRAANKLAARIVKAYGAKVDTGCAHEGLNHAWPTPSEVLALDSIEDSFGNLGVIKSRSRTIAEIARLLECGELDLMHGSNPEKQIGRLLSIKGIGPWTANYIAMRVLNYPDAFLESDAGVAHALPDLSPKERVASVEVCRPWRSYTVVAMWNSLSLQEG